MNTEKPLISDLKAQASALLPLDDPLLAYKKLFRGRESEYSYRAFLDEFCQPTVEDAGETPDDDVEDVQNVNH